MTPDIGRGAGVCAYVDGGAGEHGEGMRLGAVAPEVLIMHQQDLVMNRLESTLLILLKYNQLPRLFRTERRKAYFSALLHGPWESLGLSRFQQMDRLERCKAFIDLHQLPDSVRSLSLKA